MEYDPDIVKVSIVGLGIALARRVAAKMFGILASEGINIQAISTSEIKISCNHRREVHGARRARAARGLWARQAADRLKPPRGGVAP